MKGWTPVIAAAALLAAVPVLSQGTESYGVFCARGRVVVDSRSADQMASGQGACQLARFSDRSSAEGFARRNFNGVGGSCSCR
jgi:hypothetical protein